MNKEGFEQSLEKWLGLEKIDRDVVGVHSWHEVRCVLEERKMHWGTRGLCIYRDDNG